MSDFDPHITVEPIEEATDVNCNVKVITLDNHKLKIETPFKILSGKSLTDDAVNQISDNLKNPLFEIGTFYDYPRTYEKLAKTIRYGGNTKSWISKLNTDIGLRSSLEDNFGKNVILSSVFQYYPLNDITLRHKPKEYARLGKDEYSAYLKYIHGASTAFVLTPDVLLPPAGKRTFSIDEYLRFLDFSIETLQKYNNKPIFVPVQIDLPMSDLKQVLGHYRGDGFTNIWINFKAQRCEKSHAAKLGIILEQIDQFFKGEDYIIYSSHIKQERDARENMIPAYDMFPPFRGADFVGITRNRRFPNKGDDPDEQAQKKGFEDHADYKAAVDLRKLSLFDADSYKYVIPSIYPNNTVDDEIFEVIQKKQPSCNLFNDISINNELENVRAQIKETKIVRPYLESKAGVVEGKDVFSYAMKTDSPKKKTYQKLLRSI